MKIATMFMVNNCSIDNANAIIYIKARFEIQLNVVLKLLRF